MSNAAPSPAQPADASTSASGSGTLRPTLGREWLLKQIAFMLLLLGFGLWGALDLTWLYPRRGLADASVQLRNFAEALDKSGRLTSPALTVADLAGELRELTAKQPTLTSQAKADDLAGRSARADLAKLAWLKSLKNAWRLNPGPKFVGELAAIDAAGTTGPKRRVYFDPAKGEAFASGPGGERTPLPARVFLNELTQHWNVNEPPTPLSGFDMPVQVIFIIVGVGGGLLMIFTLLSARSTCSQISYQPSTQRLELPGRVCLTPADIQDLDKRKWHKLFVTLETTTGQKHELDLYRYIPLESWVLEMENTRFPERTAEAAKAAEAKAAAKAAEDAQAQSKSPAPGA
jgi:hypothetical protein